jgi:hypothetical protein
VPVQFFASDPDGASLTWSSVYSDDVRSYLA